MSQRNFFMLSTEDYEFEEFRVAMEDCEVVEVEENPWEDCWEDEEETSFAMATIKKKRRKVQKEKASSISSPIPLINAQSARTSLSISFTEPTLYRTIRDATVAEEVSEKQLADNTQVGDNKVANAFQHQPEIEVLEIRNARVNEKVSQEQKLVGNTQAGGDKVDDAVRHQPEIEIIEIRNTRVTEEVSEEKQLVRGNKVDNACQNEPEIEIIEIMNARVAEKVSDEQNNEDAFSTHSTVQKRGNKRKSASNSSLFEGKRKKRCKVIADGNDVRRSPRLASRYRI